MHRFGSYSRESALADRSVVLKAKAASARKLCWKAAVCASTLAPHRSPPPRASSHPPPSPRRGWARSILARRRARRSHLGERICGQLSFGGRHHVLNHRRERSPNRGVGASGRRHCAGGRERRRPAAGVPSPGGVLAAGGRREVGGTGDTSCAVGLAEAGCMGGGQAQMMRSVAIKHAENGVMRGRRCSGVVRERYKADGLS